MVRAMDENTTPKISPMQQICTLRVMFPVDSDDNAIEVKKKISSVLAEIPDVRIDFNITETNRVSRV